MLIQNALQVQRGGVLGRQFVQQSFGKIEVLVRLMNVSVLG